MTWHDMAWLRRGEKGGEGLTWTEWPACRSAIAVQRPPIPAPTTMIWRGMLGLSKSWVGGSVQGRKWKALVTHVRKVCTK
jgi:hypothetical protein